jgi:hypothetical protein
VAVTVLFIALALVAIALGLLALGVARPGPASRTSNIDDDGEPSGHAADDISEVRRGDRPNPPAPPTDRGPDNVAPFFRPDDRDERR